jgi:TPP-dependent pyruvate/acetoin dehydrogenase alpha subunit
MTDPADIELNHRGIARIGRYQHLSIDGVEPNALLTLYRQMLRLRRTEEALIREYHPSDEMRCPIHFCIGQEAVPAALSTLVRPDDYLFSHHRSSGYFFAKHAPMREFFAEIYGRKTGANGGRAGSQDISHTASRFYSGAILTGAVSIAVGVAFGLQHQGLDSIAIAGFGEGATDEGAFWEAMNYVGLKKLPILFLCENNRYATYSDQLKRQASDNICERVLPFGVRSKRIFGNDVVLCQRTIAETMDYVRKGKGAALVEAYTYRWNGHVGPENDDVNEYRSEEEIQFWKNNCPISLLEERLLEAGYLDVRLKAVLESEIAEEITAHFQFAKESPFPSETDWRAMNWEENSPLADRLLATVSRSDFDERQTDAKLEPY